ncbi:MAG: diaminopimelate decarboxylase [Phycisphaerales bacterium]
MDYFAYQTTDDSLEPIAHLMGEDVALDAIADGVGTPCFVYSARTMAEHASRFRDAFSPIDPMICYAVKACSNLAILRRLFAPQSSTASGGCGLGADVVSGLELERAWLAGCPMERIVFAGVGKSDAEIRAALDGKYSPIRAHARAHGLTDPALRSPVGVLNTESRSELERIATIAGEIGLRANVAIRVNPDIDAGTHDHTTTGRASDKFGVTTKEAESLCRAYHQHDSVRVIGFHVHLGSPIYSVDPYTRVIALLCKLIEKVESSGVKISHLDLGGGFGADYSSGQTPSYQDFAGAIMPGLMPLVRRGIRIVLEPGRTIVGNAGVLLVSVRHVKRQSGRRFVICDAGMNALIRPALYGAKHFIWPTKVQTGDIPERRSFEDSDPDEPCDVVGPVCESGDFLARGIRLPEVKRGDRLAVFTAGAYGMTMTNTYNDQQLPAEVLIDGGAANVVRERQSPIETIGPDIDTRSLSLAQETADG